jgi:hypothetical protein
MKRLFVAFLALAMIGCAPQSVKKSAVMAGQAVVVAEARVESVVDMLGDAHSESVGVDPAAAADFLRDVVLEAMDPLAMAGKALSDAGKLLVPVKLALGAPRGIVAYDPSIDQAAVLAGQAEMEQRLRNLIHDKLVNLGEKVLPAQLKRLLPDPKAEKPDDMAAIIKMAIAAFIGSGGMYGGAKTIARVSKRKESHA